MYFVYQKPFPVFVASAADLCLTKQEGTLCTILYELNFPDDYNPERRQAETADLRSVAESLNDEGTPKDYRAGLLEQVQELRRAQLARLESQARQNFRADFGRMDIGERVGSFSSSGRLDGHW